jgi:hypothetical protein
VSVWVGSVKLSSCQFLNLVFVYFFGIGDQCFKVKFVLLNDDFLEYICLKSSEKLLNF